MRASADFALFVGLTQRLVQGGGETPEDRDNSDQVREQRVLKSEAGCGCVRVGVCVLGLALQQQQRHKQINFNDNRASHAYDHCFYQWIKLLLFFFLKKNVFDKCLKSRCFN